MENRDLYDFFEYLWGERNILDGRRYIMGIEAGFELMDGEGTYTHEHYSLTVNG